MKFLTGNVKSLYKELVSTNQDVLNYMYDWDFNK